MLFPNKKKKELYESCKSYFLLQNLVLKEERVENWINWINENKHVLMKNYAYEVESFLENMNVENVSLGLENVGNYFRFTLNYVKNNYNKEKLKKFINDQLEIQFKDLNGKIHNFNNYFKDMEKATLQQQLNFKYFIKLDAVLNVIAKIQILLELGKFEDNNKMDVLLKNVNKMLELPNVDGIKNRLHKYNTNKKYKYL